MAAMLAMVRAAAGVSLVPRASRVATLFAGTCAFPYPLPPSYADTGMRIRFGEERPENSPTPVGPTAILFVVKTQDCRRNHDSTIGRAK